MVEAGSIEIGGTINVQGIETGLTRVESGLKDVGTTGKSVNADFVRMNQQAGRLGKTMGILAIAGVTAMIGIAKNAPGTAAAMAQISVSAMRLKFAVGDAMAPEFEKFSQFLDRFATWTEAHPDLFRALTKGLLIFTGATLAAGGLQAAIRVWSKFFIGIKAIAAWTGWSKLFGNLDKLGKGAGAAGGITAAAGVSGIVGAAAIPAIIETYRTGAKPSEGIFQEEIRQTQRNIIYLTKVGTEREKKFLRRLFGTVKMDTY